MLKPRSRPATYADIEALPPSMVGEIVHGVLHAHPRPAPRHGRATLRLSRQLAPFDIEEGDGPGGWIFIDEPELHLGPHVVVPDIAGWRSERLTPFPETAFIETAPDWLAEVLSPATENVDRGDKLSIYAEHRVGHCWYIDPFKQVLEARSLSKGRWRLVKRFRGADTVSAPPFETLTFALDTLWVK